jgi:hypothetical protein
LHCVSPLGEEDETRNVRRANVLRQKYIRIVDKVTGGCLVCVSSLDGEFDI